MTRILRFFAPCLFFPACVVATPSAPASPEDAPVKRCESEAVSDASSSNPSAASAASKKLSELITQYELAPGIMSQRGNPKTAKSDELESVTPQRYSAYFAELRRIYRQLRDHQYISIADLSEEEKRTLEVLKYSLRDDLALAPYREYEIPFTSDSGFYSELVGLHQSIDFRSEEQYRDYLKQLSDVPRLFDEHIENMRQGIARGFTAPAVSLKGIAQSIAAEMRRAPEASPYFVPFREFPPGVPNSKHEALRIEARNVIEQRVLPAYKKLHQFFVEEYEPRARKSLGASELPKGEKYYAQLIQHFTTLSLSADEIHQTGLSEVARIRAEMEAIRVKVGFRGDLSQFMEHLRTSPQFYAKSPEELLMRASYIAKRIDAMLPAYFGKLPVRPYGVAPVPDAIAPRYTAGRYVPAGSQSTQPGYYWVNTYDLPSRTLYTLPALTAHEGVPGHHLQISLHQEMDTIPDFRKNAGFGAYVEGWALYSERIAIEMGIYTTPYEDFGRLTYEMWRACRLVVDTGIHAKGWTREQALEYMKSNTALSLHEMETEVDRYISWPGQALGYKIGELKIRELRKLAETQLQTHFNIREFHDAILAAGPLPLPLLETQIEQYIARTLESAAEKSATQSVAP